jgi:hypothetical protein
MKKPTQTNCCYLKIQKLAHKTKKVEFGGQ